MITVGAIFNKHLIRLAILCLLACPPAAQALLNVDGTRNQVFVFGEVVLGYDSNVYAQSGGKGDFSTTASIGMELKRRAGIISVNARMVLDYVRYAKITGQNAWNPSLYLEFNKTTGRTTGAFTINAYRSSQADSAVNIRTSSWNFPLGLSLKYPVSDHIYLTSQTNYRAQRYINNSALSNYYDVGEGVDAFYVFTSKLDLLGGYRLRLSHTDKGNTTDQNFSFGATGGLLPKLNGLVRIGYQVRTIDATREKFNQLSMVSALTWNATRKLTVTGQVARDFSTTATGISVDSLSATLHGNYVFTRRFSVNAGIGGGRNLFLGYSQPRRQDEFFTWDVGAAYSYNEHLRINLTYTYLHNWSTLALSNFERSNYSLDIASRF